MADTTGRRRGPPASTPQEEWWRQIAESRLEYICSRLAEIAEGLADVTKELRNQVRTTDQQAGQMQRLDERLRDAERQLDTFEDDSRSPFIRRSEFDPVKKAVFALVGTICLAVVAAVLKLVVR